MPEAPPNYFTSAALLMVDSAIKGASNAVVTKYISEVVSPFLKVVVGKKARTKIEAATRRYLRSLELRTRSVPSIAMQTGNFLLADVYIPLTLWTPASPTEYTITRFPRDLFAEARCVAVTDDAGMGKSTLAKFIARQAMEESKQIPLFVELRRVREDTTLISAIAFELGGHDSALSEDVVSLIKSGNFLFILDGFDEVAEPLRARIIEQINDLATQFQFCYFLLTSRKEFGANAFPIFSQFEIQKLTKEQAYKLIHQYDKSGKLANSLIEKIEVAKIDEFLGNPLLVTLLYKAFDYRPKIPPKRSAFFRQVYDALFYDHDLSKGDGFERAKESGLDSEDLHKFLRSFGFVTYKAGRISFSVEEIPSLFEEASNRIGLSVDTQKLKRDLTCAVPVLSRDGLEYRWSHKSFQEYFAAFHITRDLASTRDEIVRTLFYHEDVLRFSELLKFVAETDVSIIRDVCAGRLLPSLPRSTTIGSESVGLLLADAMYIGILNKAVLQSSIFDALEISVREQFGTSINLQGCRYLVNRADGFGCVSMLNQDGLRLVALHRIDPELFYARNRKDEVSAMRQLRKEFGTRSVRFDENFLASASSQIISAATTVALVPIPDASAIKLVENAKLARTRASDLSFLERF